MFDEIRKERLKKLELLRTAGMDPYPTHVVRDMRVIDVIEKFDNLLVNETALTLAGRVMAVRGQGALIFFNLYDGSGKIQGLLKKDSLPEEVFSLFRDAIDIGDFVQVTGTFFVSKSGEKTIMVTEWKVLAKTLRPLPDKVHGLQDEEEKLRRRYLDILFDEETRELIYIRAKFWNAVRAFHLKYGFIEVETPVLENTTGGADAEPFATHHNSLDLDVYLRISAGELWQKRLMVAGIEKTFEIGRIFRNEGMSAEHLQDYTQCEAYWAYSDYKDMYEFLRECYQFVAQETFGTLQFKIKGFDIDLSGKWPLMDFAEEIKKQTGIDIWTATQSDMVAKLQELKVDASPEANTERLIDILWKYCRKNIAGPAILINEPKITSPLAKVSLTDPRVTERFHFVIAGSEIGQGYSELNDPIDQAERFALQQKLRDAGDQEAQMADYEFIEALEYGMPPTSGHGFSERLLAFLMDKPVRETQIFPLMKPKQEL